MYVYLYICCANQLASYFFFPGNCYRSEGDGGCHTPGWLMNDFSPISRCACPAPTGSNKYNLDWLRSKLVTTYDLDSYFFRRCKPKIGTGIQYTTHVYILKKIPNFTGRKCTKMGKKGERESAG